MATKAKKTAKPVKRAAKRRTSKLQRAELQQAPLQRASQFPSGPC